MQVIQPGRLYYNRGTLKLAGNAYQCYGKTYHEVSIAVSAADGACLWLKTEHKTRKGTGNVTLFFKPMLV